MSDSFRVNGGLPANGTIRPAGNKNAALPMIAASLLADSPVTITNVPKIGDVTSMLSLIEDLGASVSWTGTSTLVIDPSSVTSAALDVEMCSRIRASILLAGPLLARFGNVALPPPGGDVIGRRRVDTHFVALETLGAEIEIGPHYVLTAKELVGADIFLDEPSVTGTENALMASVLAKGTTVLRNAASEPHVQDLARALIAMGASIEGIGTNALTIQGVDKLHGAEIEVGPDHIEVGSFIGLAAMTGGRIEITDVRPDDLRAVLFQFSRLGIEPTLNGTTLVVEADQERRIRADLGGYTPKIEDGPWPAFPADLMSIMVVTATQCHGQVLLFEKMFESRLFFTDLLVSLGANIILCDPHRAVVTGPTHLHGGTVQSPDIRAGMAVLLATLAAPGPSVIHNIRQIDRGYERIDERLTALGLSIERFSTDG